MSTVYGLAQSLILFYLPVSVTWEKRNKFSKMVDSRMTGQPCRPIRIRVCSSYVKYTYARPHPFLTQSFNWRCHQWAGFSILFYPSDVLIDRLMCQIIITMTRSRAPTLASTLVSPALVLHNSSALCLCRNQALIRSRRPFSSNRDIFPKTGTRRIKETPPAWPHPM